MQVNLLVGRQVASYFDGANAWLYYADRLYQLPLGVVGIAVGIVLLPDLSRRLAAQDTDGGRAAFNRAAELSLALTIPCAVALAVIPLPLVSVLFERGSFLPADAQATALATAIYGLGLPAFVLQKVFQPLFFAREDTRSPFYFAIVALVVNAVIAIGLLTHLGFISAAWGTTVAGMGNAGLPVAGQPQVRGGGAGGPPSSDAHLAHLSGQWYHGDRALGVAGRQCRPAACPWPALYRVGPTDWRGYYHLWDCWAGLGGLFLG